MTVISQEQAWRRPARPPVDLATHPGGLALQRAVRAAAVDRHFNALANATWRPYAVDGCYEASSIVADAVARLFRQHRVSEVRRRPTHDGPWVSAKVDGEWLSTFIWSGP